jgi:DNA-binding response OmpR family regulator
MINEGELVAKKEKKKIAIIDDDEDLLKLLVAGFQGKGFDVKAMATGKEGMAFLSNEKNLEELALIILDRMLPDMDGIEILKEFQSRFPRKVPVLILSVLTAEKDVLKGLKGGAVDYVGKPFSLPILMEKALTLMEK